MFKPLKQIISVRIIELKTHNLKLKTNKNYSSITKVSLVLIA